MAISSFFDEKPQNCKIALIKIINAHAQYSRNFQYELQKKIDQFKLPALKKLMLQKELDFVNNKEEPRTTPSQLQHENQLSQKFMENNANKLFSNE